jgi:hypothetical protein
VTQVLPQLCVLTGLVGSWRPSRSSSAGAPGFRDFPGLPVVKENRNDSLRTLHFPLSICSKGACNGKELIARAIHDRRRHIAGATKIAAIAT